MADPSRARGKGSRGRASRRWEGFLTGEPSGRFMLWIRRVLVAIWILIVALYAPALVQQYYETQTSIPPGPERNAAMWKLLLEAATELVVGPFLLFAILGYGIRIRNAGIVWSTGGPWFDIWWCPRGKSNGRRKPSGCPPAYKDRSEESDPARCWL